jgi:hypothetical protein
MLKRVSLRGVVALASILGVVVPITLLARTRLFPTHLFGSLELLLYHGSIFLFDESPHSTLFSLSVLALSIMATVALYALAAMILYGIFRSTVRAWRFVQRR